MVMAATPTSPESVPPGTSKPTRTTAPSERMLKLSLTSIIDVLPTHPDQRLRVLILQILPQNSPEIPQAAA
jgi:hypothetical protein